MKSIKTIILVIALAFSFGATAQRSNASHKNNGKAHGNKHVAKSNYGSMDYYYELAYNDARYEQQYRARSAKDAKEFWKARKKYEKELMKRDRKAYKAYLKAKIQTYASHYDHCDSHCYHGDDYYSHASFYYNGYDNYYDRYPRGNRTTVRVSTPSVRISTPNLSIGIF